MSLSLSDIANLDHDTLLASGNTCYKGLLDELDRLRQSCTDEANDSYVELQNPPLRIKYSPDGRRLVYRVKPVHAMETAPPT
ncbi:hypothetical protein H0H93_001989 [Arthromyces matolae]|nr:hypothetical protein H0H93_001989 [Arthromyces matolae]